MVCLRIADGTPLESPPGTNGWLQLRATRAPSPTMPPLAGEGPPLEETRPGLLIGGSAERGQPPWRLSPA